jgi:hypothetical protein
LPSHGAHGHVKGAQDHIKGAQERKKGAPENALKKSNSNQRHSLPYQAPDPTAQIPTAQILSDQIPIPPGADADADAA